MYVCEGYSEKYLDLLLSSLKKVIPVGDKDPTLVIPFRSGGSRNSWGFLNVFKSLKVCVCVCVCE